MPEPADEQSRKDPNEITSFAVVAEREVLKSYNPNNTVKSPDTPMFQDLVRKLKSNPNDAHDFIAKMGQFKQATEEKTSYSPMYDAKTDIVKPTQPPPISQPLPSPQYGPSAVVYAGSVGASLRPPEDFVTRYARNEQGNFRPIGGRGVTIAEDEMLQLSMAAHMLGPDSQGEDLVIKDQQHNIYTYVVKKDYQLSAEDIKNGAFDWGPNSGYRNHISAICAINRDLTQTNMDYPVLKTGVPMPMGLENTLGRLIGSDANHKTHIALFVSEEYIRDNRQALKDVGETLTIKPSQLLAGVTVPEAAPLIDQSKMADRTHEPEKSGPVSATGIGKPAGMMERL